MEKTIFETLKKAIDVEMQYSYIDIQGKSRKFSQFVISELKNIYKQSEKNQKWLELIEIFKFYPTDSLENRRKSCKKILLAIKDELKPSVEKDVRGDLENFDIKFLKGVGPKFAYIYYKLGVSKVFDILEYYPKKYIDYTETKKIKDIEENQNVTIEGYVKSFSAFNSKKGLTVVKISISDETGTVLLNYFFKNQNRFLLEKYRKEFKPQSKIILSGKVKFDDYNCKFQITNPKYEFVDQFSNEKSCGKIVPIYPLVEGLQDSSLKRHIEAAFLKMKGKIKNAIPEKFKSRYSLLDKEQAMREVHFPTCWQNLEKARQTLIYEEFFILELKMAIIRCKNEKNFSEKFEFKEGGLIDKFLKNLPFELTSAQKNAANEILTDICSTKPMHRLLEGDVGCGKTVVACLLVLCAVENGFQTAIMAPTEILASQHFNSFVKWLMPLNVPIGLFLGSNCAKTKKQLSQALQNGQIKVAIGTHALIQENIKFQNLGAIIIDEQHRFGVEQRAKLKQKGKMPHILTMSATPIPRSLALSLNGDLDISIIDELPHGRKPVKTTLLKNSQREEAFKLIKLEISKGHQAYIVYPLIEESDALLNAKACEDEAKYLQENEFKGYKIGILHGRLSNEEKETVMIDFKTKKYDILVATTVVEVGVDVENATVMVIENAERFGLAQLHQLRGRVGRSSKQSYCVLISNSKNEQTQQRLDIMTQTTNGFVIAQKDLELRGPGEYLGTRQSGIQQLKIADIVNDVETLEQAKKDAFEFVKTYNIQTIEDFFDEKFEASIDI